MKSFLIVLGLIAVVAADDFIANTNEDLNKYRLECVKELSIPADVFEEYKKWNFKEDDSTKNYIHCMFKKMRLYEDGKGTNVEHTIIQLSHNKNDDLRGAIVKCRDEEHLDNDALRAWNGFICFKRQNLSLIRTSVGLN